MFCVVLLFFMV